MAHLIDKAALVAEITHKIKVLEALIKNFDGISDKVEKAKNKIEALGDALLFIDTLEVIDPYEQCIQYASIESGIKAHAEEYSFNIESELFNQLTKEQQALWRKEIEQACISGGYNGLGLAKDPRYKENLEVKEVDSEKELDEWIKYGPHTNYPWCTIPDAIKITAEHFFELGLKAQKVEIWQVVDNVNHPQADKNKIYCVFTKDRYILATVINHPKDEELLQWKCTEFPHHRYDMCEGDKYMVIN